MLDPSLYDIQRSQQRKRLDLRIVLKRAADETKSWMG
jgi:hypothetical protein